MVSYGLRAKVAAAQATKPNKFFLQRTTYTQNSFIYFIHWFVFFLVRKWMEKVVHTRRQAHRERENEVKRLERRSGVIGGGISNRSTSRHTPPHSSLIFYVK